MSQENLAESPQYIQLDYHEYFDLMLKAFEGESDRSIGIVSICIIDEQLEKLIGKDVAYLTNLEKLPKDVKISKDQKHLVLHTKNTSNSIILIIVDNKVRLGSIIR